MTEKIATVRVSVDAVVKVFVDVDVFKRDGVYQSTEVLARELVWAQIKSGQEIPWQKTEPVIDVSREYKLATEMMWPLHPVEPPPSIEPAPAPSSK